MTNFSSEKKWKIGEHLAKLQAKSWLFEAPFFLNVLHKDEEQHWSYNWHHIIYLWDTETVLAVVILNYYAHNEYVSKRFGNWSAFGNSVLFFWLTVHNSDDLAKQNVQCLEDVVSDSVKSRVVRVYDVATSSKPSLS